MKRYRKSVTVTMDEFRLKMVVEIEQVGNGLAIRTPVPLDVVCRRGQWQARCDELAVLAPEATSLEQALISGAQGVHAELQGAVCERPLGRITPEEVNALFA